jgi:SAM-dependent methyltransferase
VQQVAERRQDREREFHDALFAEDGEARSEAGRFYDIVDSSQRAYWNALMAHASGADCLEYGCAYGDNTIAVAKIGTSATGIDISGVVIDKARHAAADQRSPARFEVAEAESLPFADASFDLAFGNSVLHHLELRTATAEMARVLRPSGTGVFAEPLGHNRLINWYRSRTPELRTPDEHPLVKSDFELFAEYFARVEVRFFHLAALGAAFLSGRSGYEAARRVLGALDRRILTPRSPLRYQAWVCVVLLEGPKPSD